MVMVSMTMQILMLTMLYINVCMLCVVVVGGEGGGAAADAAGADGEAFDYNGDVRVENGLCMRRMRGEHV